MTLGRWVKRQRGSDALRTMARRIMIGHTTLASIERDEREHNYTTLFLLVRALGRPPRSVLRSVSQATRKRLQSAIREIDGVGRG